VPYYWERPPAPGGAWDLSGGRGADLGRLLRKQIWPGIQDSWDITGGTPSSDSNPLAIAQGLKDQFMGYYAAGNILDGKQTFGPAAGAAPFDFTKAGRGVAGPLPSAAAASSSAAAPARHHHRMNALNPRALRRAMRRTAAFVKFAKHAFHFEHAVRPKHHRKAPFGGRRK
jgi:hypothetical protein